MTDIQKVSCPGHATLHYLSLSSPTSESSKLVVCYVCNVKTVKVTNPVVASGRSIAMTIMQAGIVNDYCSQAFLSLTLNEWRTAGPEPDGSSAARQTDIALHSNNAHQGGQSGQGLPDHTSQDYCGRNWRCKPGYQTGTYSLLHVSLMLLHAA